MGYKKKDVMLYICGGDENRLKELETKFKQIHESYGSDVLSLEEVVPGFSEFEGTPLFEGAPSQDKRNVSGVILTNMAIGDTDNFAQYMHVYIENRRLADVADMSMPDVIDLEAEDYVLSSFTDGRNLSLADMEAYNISVLTQMNQEDRRHAKLFGENAFEEAFLRAKHPEILTAKDIHTLEKPPFKYYGLILNTENGGGRLAQAQNLYNEKIEKFVRDMTIDKIDRRGGTPYESSFVKKSAKVFEDSLSGQIMFDTIFDRLQKNEPTDFLKDELYETIVPVYLKNKYADYTAHKGERPKTFDVFDDGKEQFSLENPDIRAGRVNNLNSKGKIRELEIEEGDMRVDVRRLKETVLENEAKVDAQEDIDARQKRKDDRGATMDREYTALNNDFMQFREGTARQGEDEFNGFAEHPTHKDEGPDFD